MHEKKLTPHIIWIGFMWYCLNSEPCQLDVKLSNAIYEQSKKTPESVVVLEPLLSFPVSNIKKSIPSDKRRAVKYSYDSYFVLEIIFPRIMTGIVLVAFASTWYGNDTYFKASY
uniref:Neurotransmitter-gated ion-channel transmembrane domain-containing protein n=1 Tax=Photinus pyralis TaxID=7054 RepID=A0A1Y1MVP3_PHOPY